MVTKHRTKGSRSALLRAQWPPVRTEKVSERERERAKNNARTAIALLEHASARMAALQRRLKVSALRGTPPQKGPSSRGKHHLTTLKIASKGIKASALAKGLCRAVGAERLYRELGGPIARRPGYKHRKILYMERRVAGVKRTRACTQRAKAEGRVDAPAVRRSLTP